MRVFVTGATGLIGSALVKEWIGAEHAVLGLCRFQDKATALTAADADLHCGSIEDLDRLRQTAPLSVPT